MIQLHLHHLYCSFLDEWRTDEAEEDLRDAVVEETGRMRFDSCPIEEVEEYAAWFCTSEEEADWIDGQECWKPDCTELEEALRRRLFDCHNDLREELPTAAE